MLLGVIAIGAVIALQISGSLQGFELRAFDQYLLHRPTVAIDDRIVLIDETEADIRRHGHPLPDQVLADALLALEKAGARVIGVDKYRDVAVEPGTEALNAVLQQHNNIVWIFFAGNSTEEYIPAPSVLLNNPERAGFNDIIEDPDGVSRRGLLFLDLDGNSYYAFPLLLTLHYLAHENIGAQSDSDGYLSLNGVSLPRIDADFGAYSGIDAAGYQIMLDFPGLQQPFKIFSLSDLLDGKIPVDVLRDKLVLLGSTSPSLHDYRLLPNEFRGFGIDYHAYFSSQLLNSALNRKQPLRAWPNAIEYVWLGLWCLVGVFTGLRRGGLRRLMLLIVAELLLLLICSQLLFNQGWWLPLVMPLLGWAAALGASVLFFFTRERAERRQLMQLFASHVSPEVANRLWEVRDQFFSEGGVRPDTLTATVLFTDLSNFTTVAESMEPLVLMSWLNQYMDEMSRIVIDHGGIINKYIGDAIMAVFGVPVKRETETDIAIDARHAVQCALDFNFRLRELNQQWQAQGLPTITMRTGIQTGPLVAGSFGGALRMEYTVIGDTVNTASRLESFDKTVATPDSDHPCRILIGETTYKYVYHSCKALMVGECQLKGKNKQLKIYRVIPPGM
ncbi:adenylate/guanylate cyclase domain-containing protein [Methylomonas sp. LL1]|uniref:CHASE2 domain-containing protein n=1 Tax=Methylomonas sp. LL1 TaxID=2785785 RepID=UPI0018C421D9|nr:adenylate/guanylate cyclase domain-containing protein [Methylomonas sp. LL1]QPK63695.1 adenylate/guanylate cyclase domain-containing protein [Methylomonas sp. LL1]